MFDILANLREQGLGGTNIAVRLTIKTFFRKTILFLLLPKIREPDYTTLPKLPEGMVYLQWRIDKYEEHLRQQQILENSE